MHKVTTMPQSINLIMFFCFPVSNILCFHFERNNSQMPLNFTSQKNLLVNYNMQKTAESSQNQTSNRQNLMHNFMKLARKRIENTVFLHSFAYIDTFFIIMLTISEIYACRIHSVGLFGSRRQSITFRLPFRHRISSINSFSSCSLFM